MRRFVPVVATVIAVVIYLGTHPVPGAAQTRTAESVLAAAPASPAAVVAVQASESGPVDRQQTRRSPALRLAREIRRDAKTCPEARPGFRIRLGPDCHREPAACGRWRKCKSVPWKRGVEFDAAVSCACSCYEPATQVSLTPSPASRAGRP